MYPSKMILIPDDKQHSTEEIAAFLKCFIDAPLPDYEQDDFKEFISDSGLSLYDFTRIALFVNDQLFYFKENLNVEDFTVYYLIVVASQALILHQEDWVLIDDYIADIMHAIEEAYLHNNQTDKLLSDIINYY